MDPGWLNPDLEPTLEKKPDLNPTYKNKPGSGSNLRINSSDTDPTLKKTGFYIKVNIDTVTLVIECCKKWSILKRL